MTAKDVIRPTDDEARRLAKTLLRSARFGALATLEPETGWPFVTRAGVATDLDGTPILLISGLAAHTRALKADTRCSLLVGKLGRGDPLAHPRLTLCGRARRLEADSPEHRQALRRYLAKNPKGRLYSGLPDFAPYRIEIERASLNGGFGRAFLLTAADMLSDAEAAVSLAAAEEQAIEHMNADHADAVALYATRLAGAEPGRWTLTGIDPDGLDLAAGDQVARIFFESPLKGAADMRPALVAMAAKARNQAEIV